MASYSNCSAACINPSPHRISSAEKSSARPLFIESGLKWQCVEYARRWWVMRRGIRFESVDTAAQMWTKIRSAQHVRDGSSAPVEARPNGGLYAPQIGDLVIYRARVGSPQLRFGHVAVVVGIDRGRRVHVAEQNFSNRPWEVPEHYARSIPLTLEQGRYTLREKQAIYGWLHLRAD